MIQEKRKFEVLRVSVTSNCALGCVYCAPKGSEESYPAGAHPAFLSTELFTSNIERLSKKIDIKEVHLTGGEPTHHKELPELISRANRLGIPDIAVTSNGIFSDGLIEKMKLAGLTRMNFSVDTLSSEGFRRMTGRNVSLDKLLSRVEEAIAADLNVKINSTVLRGYNEDQVLPLLLWAGEKNIPIRYLELMKMGPLQNRHKELFYSAEEIRSQIRSRFDFLPWETPADSTAKYFKTEIGSVFGVIANHTEPFCGGCNRLRMDVRGRIYGCLSDTRSYPVSEVESELEDALDSAMKTKKDEFTGSLISMKYIGG